MTRIDTRCRKTMCKMEDACIKVASQVRREIGAVV